MNFNCFNPCSVYYRITAASYADTWLTSWQWGIPTFLPHLKCEAISGGRRLVDGRHTRQESFVPAKPAAPTHDKPSQGTKDSYKYSTGRPGGVLTYLINHRSSLHCKPCLKAFNKPVKSFRIYGIRLYSD